MISNGMQHMPSEKEGLEASAGTAGKRVIDQETAQSQDKTARVRKKRQHSEHSVTKEKARAAVARKDTKEPDNHRTKEKEKGSEATALIVGGLATPRVSAKARAKAATEAKAAKAFTA